MRPARLSSACRLAPTAFLATAPPARPPSPDLTGPDSASSASEGPPLIAGDQMRHRPPGHADRLPDSRQPCGHRSRLRSAAGTGGWSRGCCARRTACWETGSARRSPPMEPHGGRGARGNRRRSRLRVRAWVGWTLGERARLSAPGGRMATGWGSSIALRGGVLLAGRPGRDAERGAVAVFARGTGRRRMEAARGLVQAKAAAGGDWFGAALAFDGQRALVGAPGETGSAIPTGRRQGQAFVFRSTSGSGARRPASSPRRRSPWLARGCRPPRRQRGPGWSAAGGQHGGRRGRGIAVRGPRGPRPAPSLRTRPLRPAGFGIHPCARRRGPPGRCAASPT